MRGKTSTLRAQIWPYLRQHFNAASACGPGGRMERTGRYQANHDGTRMLPLGP